MSELDYPYVASNQDKCFLNTSKIVARMERFTAIYVRHGTMLLLHMDYTDISE